MLRMLRGTLAIPSVSGGGAIWKNFQELNQGITTTHYEGTNGPSTFCELLFSLFVCSEWMWNKCPPRRTSFVSRHTVLLEQSGCSSEPACRRSGMARLLRFPEGKQVKVCHVSSGVKANCSWEAADTGTEQTRLTQIYESRMCTRYWVDGGSNFHTVGNWEYGLY